MNGSILVTSIAVIAALSLGFPRTQEGKQEGKPKDAAAMHDMTPPKPGKEHEAL